MDSNVRVITNHVPRDVIDACELTAQEREQFDYLDWPAIDRLEDTASFFRFCGDLYDLGEFSADWGISRDTGLPVHLAGWDAYMSTSAFTALVVRFCSWNGYYSRDHVVVGTVLS